MLSVNLGTQTGFFTGTMSPNEGTAKSFVWIGPIDGIDSIDGIDGIDGNATEERAKGSTILTTLRRGYGVAPR
jgi:hypothetical protein